MVSLPSTDVNRRSPAHVRTLRREADPGAVLLGGEVGLEHAVEKHLGDPGPVVDHVDGDVGTGPTALADIVVVDLDQVDLDADFPAGLDHVGGVDHEVGDDPLEAGFVDSGGRSVETILEGDFGLVLDEYPQHRSRVSAP